MENILKSIEDIVNTFDRVTTEYGDAPVAGSQAEKEIESYPDKSRIKEPFSFARLNLKASREQFAAMPDLVKGEKFFTNPVAARAVLESSALALWLLETGIDEKERVTRGMIQLCDGKNQLRKFHNDDKNAAASDQITDFFDNRLPPILAANGITLRGKPAIIDLITNNLGQDFRLAYRILSGFAHGQPNILLTFGYDIANAVAEDGMNKVEYKPHDQIQLYSFDIAGKSFMKALETYFQIFNWEFDKIKPSFDSFFAELAEAVKNTKK